MPISLPKFLGVSMMYRSKTPVFHGYLARINVNQTTLTCLFGPWNTGISENLGNDMSLCTRMAFFSFASPAMQQSAKDMGLVAFISPIVLQRSGVSGSCIKKRFSSSSRRDSPESPGISPLRRYHAIRVSSELS